MTGVRFNDSKPRWFHAPQHEGDENHASEQQHHDNRCHGGIGCITARVRDATLVERTDITIGRYLCKRPIVKKPELLQPCGQKQVRSILEMDAKQ